MAIHEFIDEFIDEIRDLKKAKELLEELMVKSELDKHCYRKVPIEIWYKIEDYLGYGDNNEE